MEKNMLNSCDFAAFLAENINKENVIPAIFDYFRLDCFERCNINPLKLDGLIKKFNETDGFNADIIAQIIDLIKNGKADAANKENELVKNIALCVSDNLSDEISIEEIARKLNISYYYMCHIFKSKYGISVNTFRIHKKLEIAMRLLISGNATVTDIAMRSGFNNVSYFTEVFTKYVGVSPTLFRKENEGIFLHNFYGFYDILLATKMQGASFMCENISEVCANVKTVSINEPDENFGFLHETAVIEYKGVLYASWYGCPKFELNGYTPICGKRSYDGGETWTDLEIICEDKSGKILYCPPVYGICDGRLYMLVNQMTAPDHIHALDIYVLNNKTEKFELARSMAIPFKLNTNVVTLPNGKLMLPGRIAEQLDTFPNTPAVLISDSGKINDEWRLVRIAKNGDLPDGKKFVHPEISAAFVGNELCMFCRNDQRRVPVVYISSDCGENFSEALSCDIPYINSKIYSGNLSSGAAFIIANIDKFHREKLAIYFTDNKNNNKFKKRIILFDKNTTEINEVAACHYPAAFESNGKLFITATLEYENSKRAAVLFIVNLKEV